MPAESLIDREGRVVPHDGREPGAVLAPEDAIDALLPALDRLALIAVTFPKFRDGRGFTQIRALRERGYRGEIRAVGHVLPDQFMSLVRCGVSTVALPEGADPAVWRAVLALHGGGETQPVAERAWPLLRRLAVPFEA
jgi:uncharacterized protein (DUF934 family)